ncbi:MAG: hypothetical protein F9K22_10990 [Bacteroidetes bacterium]|nr:MAG: hypothetical protein F9K22_10990 [Bacteroidota bacterium]
MSRSQNFLLPEIHQYALQRIQNKTKDETIDEYRLMNNMLSSMPMCFNMFVPLKMAAERNEPFVTRIFQTILREINLSVVIKRICRIEIEYVPIPRSDYLNDKTAFDAFVEFLTVEGKKGCIGIEVKYTDALGRNNPKDMDRSYDIANQLECFTLSGLRSIKSTCPQIVRNYLLLQQWKRINYAQIPVPLVVALSVDKDVDYDISQFNNMLNDSADKMKRLSWERIIEIIQTEIPSYYKTWISDFNKRYII